MTQQRVYNFSPGPAVLPKPVLEEAQKELLNYQSTGMSVMEMSHRSKAFESILADADSGIRRLLKISDDYAVLFLQGGASLQFSMVPMNLYLQGHPVDVVQTGMWSKKAVEELAKLGEYRVVASSEVDRFTYIPSVDRTMFNQDASYAYITSNNTIYGTQWQVFPDTQELPLVADMSSDFLSKSVDVSKFGLIFAGAQKNIGPSGVTVVIVKKELAKRASVDLPTMLQYRTHIQHGSLYNTPPTFGIYIISLVTKWIEKVGGLSILERMNQEKAAILYQAIDESMFYTCPNHLSSRSLMNVVFRIQDNREDLETLFASEAAKHGLLELKGHRSVGGLRASIYNAQPKEAILELVSFMKAFEKRHG